MIPLADLLIAATAVHLDIPLLTCDHDFARGRRLAARDRRHRTKGGGGVLWQRLELHPASVPSR
jgi:hypothetical protein